MSEEFFEESGYPEVEAEAVRLLSRSMKLAGRAYRSAGEYGAEVAPEQPRESVVLDRPEASPERAEHLDAPAAQLPYEPEESERREAEVEADAEAEVEAETVVEAETQREVEVETRDEVEAEQREVLRDELEAEESIETDAVPDPAAGPDAAPRDPRLDPAAYATDTLDRENADAAAEEHRERADWLRAEADMEFRHSLEARAEAVVLTDEAYGMLLSGDESGSLASANAADAATTRADLHGRAAADATTRADTVEAAGPAATQEGVEAGAAVVHDSEHRAAPLLGDATDARIDELRSEQAAAALDRMDDREAAEAAGVASQGFAGPPSVTAPGAAAPAPTRGTTLSRSMGPKHPGVPQRPPTRTPATGPNLSR